MNWNPDTTPNFSRSEMSCSCGTCNSSCEMDQDFMAKLQFMRDLVGPMTITSGYRCANHPEEAKKDNPGSHAQGTAADIAITGSFYRHNLLNAATAAQMAGIGIANSFLHVDSGHKHASRPASWVYS